MQTFGVLQPSRIPAAIALRGVASLPRPTRPAVFGASRCFARGEEIFAEGERCRMFYKVVSGTVRSSKLLSDGRRQIDAFHFAGDVFGLEGGESHRVSAETVDRVVVLAYPRSAFGDLAQSDPVLGEQVLASMLGSLDRAHDHMVLLGRKTALEKMASFLLGLANRRDTTDRIELPMQRTDIADHLGLTIETVSRTLTQMVRAGLIRLTDAGRTVIPTDRTGLQQLCT